MGRRLDAGVSWEIVDPDADSDKQRRLFAMCDLHVASRYHPTIFGHTGCVPGVCLYYEHKALGFMKQVGLERFAFDIRRPESATLCEAVDELLEQRESLVEHLRSRVPELQRRARRTTELAVGLLHSGGVQRGSD